MKENTIPVLLVHGTADSNVPVEMTIQAAKKLHRTVKNCLLVEGAEHGTGYLVDNAGYVQALQELLLCKQCRETLKFVNLTE